MTAHDEQLMQCLAPPVAGALSRWPSPLGKSRVSCIVESRYKKQRPAQRGPLGCFPQPPVVSWCLLHWKTTAVTQESVLTLGAKDSSLILRLPGFHPGFTPCVLEQVTYRL